MLAGGFQQSCHKSLKVNALKIEIDEIINFNALIVTKKKGNLLLKHGFKFTFLIVMSEMKIIFNSDSHSDSAKAFCGVFCSLIICLFEMYLNFSTIFTCFRNALMWVIQTFCTLVLNEISNKGHYSSLLYFVPMQKKSDWRPSNGCLENNTKDRKTTNSKSKSWWILHNSPGCFRNLLDASIVND